MNQISLVIISFERFICKATADAKSRITDPEVRAEARLFRGQEGVHAAAHRKHTDALLAQYPGLQSVLDKVQQSYDEMYDSQPLEYHLAYSGGLEAIFTPFFKMVLYNRATLFGGGDRRLASMLLWHFCEEIEHRRSALMIYDHVVGSYWYRVKNTRKFLAHTVSLFDMAIEEFKAHVPDVPHEVYDQNPFADVPRYPPTRPVESLGASPLQGRWFVRRTVSPTASALS